MIDLQAYLDSKLRDIISSWNEDGIYAVSFFVYSNEAYEYNGYSNITKFSVSYNTESDCGNAGELSEERWSYAFWRQNETEVIGVDDGNEGIKILFDWYKEKGISNIGFEDLSKCYDDDMRYVGKGPVGYSQSVRAGKHCFRRRDRSGIQRQNGRNKKYFFRFSVNYIIKKQAVYSSLFFLSSYLPLQVPQEELCGIFG